MKLCSNCKNLGRLRKCESYTRKNIYADGCNDYADKKLSNADRIRNMTNEELAEFLERFELGDIDYSVTFCDLCKEGGNALNLDCSGCLRHWLESECDA